MSMTLVDLRAAIVNLIRLNHVLMCRTYKIGVNYKLYERLAWQVKEL
jgi:hypothetical protein